MKVLFFKLTQYTKAGSFGVYCLPRHSYLPNFNHIEYIWACIKQKINALPITRLTNTDKLHAAGAAV